ncbi:MAG: transcriptional repressor [Dysgonamonadaceae bacterium]|nr:transcriptional repressor [Dysgonamonadaceae bacterium]
MDKDKIKDIVRQKFTDYLTVKKCRKTPERFAILDMIYSIPGHFDMDSLNNAMNNEHFRVSKGTLYNTMQLLLDCKLVLKHQFGNSHSHYERAFNNDFHHHLICSQCGCVQEYKDNELKSMIQNKKIKRFTPSLYSLYIFGICGKCSAAMKRRKNNTK